MSDETYIWSLIVLLLLLLTAIFLLGRRLGWKRNDDLKSRYNRARGLCISYAIFIPMMVVVAFQRHDQSLFQKFFSPGCLTILFGIFFYQFLAARRKMRAQPGFARQKTSRPTPVFFWQAVLILLPVAVLAVVSLISLRRDEQAAERDARQRAAESVQSLAKVIRYAVNDEIHRFITLENMWTMELRYASQPSVTGSPDRKLASDIAKWESDYPGLKFFGLATGEGKLLADGRQIDPPDTPVVPLPPKWFRELSPEQKILWDRLPKKFTTTTAREPAFGAFENSGVSDATRQAAFNLEQRLKYRNFTYGVPLSDSEFSESGLSFRSVALQQMLCDPGTPITNSLQQAFWSEVIDTPSFAAPLLLDLAEKRTNEADTVTCEKMRCLRQLWNLQSKERAWLAPLRSVPELKDKWNPPAFWARWTGGESGEALAFGEPTTFERMGNDLEGVVYSGQGHGIWFVPRALIEAIFTSTLTKNKYLIPSFAEATVLVEDKELPVSSRQGGNLNQSLLGAAAGKFGDSSRPDSANFELKFYLTSREQMLSSERHRAKVFNALILGAALAAFIGLLAARRAFRRQLQLNEMKTNFVSSVSHELRAPIASVRLMAENLESGKVPDPARQSEYFRFIGQECRRLSSLIENVLDFSRIEQGRKQYEFEPTDLVALTRTTVKLMEPYAMEKGVTLNLETSNAEHRTPNIELKVDGRAIQQALVNLIDNAVKHTAPKQAVTVGLEMKNESAAPEVHLFVADHGPGIPLAEQERIFEQFYRLGSELRRETQGIGIGLSIVKHIVSAHGGRVTVASAPGHGSRFTIELPLEK
jgi:signal transduction histidine kinase